MMEVKDIQSREREVCKLIIEREDGEGDVNDGQPYT